MSESPGIYARESQDIERDSPEFDQEESVDAPSSDISVDFESTPLFEDSRSNKTSGQSAPDTSTRKQQEIGQTVPGPPQAEIEEPAELPETEPIEPPPINDDNPGELINSLNNQPATTFVAGMKEVGQLAPSVANQEQQRVQDSLPEIDQPTGLPVKGSSELPAYVPKKGKAPSLKAKTGGPENVVEQKHDADLRPIPEQKKPNISEPDAQQEEEESWWSRMVNYIQRNLDSLRTSDSGVNTSAGPRPKVDTSGEADPVQNDEAAVSSQATVEFEQQKADANTQEYRGEQEIYPEMKVEKLRPNVNISEAPDREAQAIEDIELTQEVREIIDKDAQEKINNEVTPEIDKNSSEYDDYQDEAAEKHEDADREIESETARIRSEQETAQNEAKSTVETERENWKKDNEGVRDDYTSDAQQKRTEVDEQIDTEIETKESKINEEYDQAEEDARELKEKKEKEAREEKEKAKKPRSFWERVGDAVGDFFDSIRDTLNTIFDALREGVKFLIEKAKEAVNGLIELARKAIVGFIKAFGEALKVLVSVALAAFPEIRDRVLGAIDKAVEIAEDIVNKLAEGLKKIANFILDSLGAALDAILAAYQAIYNAVLDVLEFITVGLLAIIEGLSNLVMSAAEMPGQFWGQLSEEFLGMDVSKPLPFEISDVSSSEGGSVEDQQDLEDYASKESYSENDFHMEEVPRDMELSPELMTMISQMGEGEELTFGENNENTMDSLLGEMIVNEEGQAANPNDLLNADAESTQGPSMPDNIKDDPYAQVDWFIQYQNSQAGQGSLPDSAEGKQPADSDSVPDEMKIIGPLTVGARLYYLKEQMMSAISKKWQENKWTYIGIGAAVVLAITALAIATGGAIFGLIPPALQIFAAIMGAMAIINAATYFGNYIKEGWVGKLIEGGMNLARSIGILLVELIFILLFDLNTLLKVLKSGVKGSLKMAANAAKNTFKALGTSLKATGKGLMKSGRKVVTVFKGVSKGVGKQAKNLDDFAKRLLKKFKFKGFKFKVKGFRFQLLGNVNPWILLASGEIKEVTVSTGTKVGDFGKFAAKDSDEVLEGLVIGFKSAGETSSQFVKHLKDNPVLRTALNNLKTSAKNLDLEKVIRGLSKAPVEKVDNIFKAIENLKNTEGIDQVLKDLASGGNKSKGAQWVLEFIGKNPQLAKSITKLESKLDDIGRIYDVQIGNVFYEFKNWSNFVEPSFIKQIARDVKNPDRFRWLFSNTISKSASEVREIARRILNNPKKLGKYLSEAEILELTKPENIERALDAIRVIQ